MSFNEEDHDFIKDLNDQQREAMIEVSQYFESHSEGRFFPTGSRQHETAKSDPTGDLESPKIPQVFPKQVSQSGDRDFLPNKIHFFDHDPDEDQNHKIVPNISMDDSGVFFWDDPMSFDENGKKVRFRCPAIVQKGAMAGKQCFAYAGLKTDHYGIGYCIAHGGAKRKGRAHAGWVFMHSIAKAINVSPWDALLGQIRLLAGQVAWLTEKVGTIAISDEELLPEGQAFYWMELLERRGDRLAKVSKMAIDAGIAERFITLMEDQASLLNSAVKKATIEMGLNENDQYELLTKIALNYQELEQSNTAGAAPTGQVLDDPYGSSRR